MDVTNRFNHALEEITVSGIRRFDEQVSHIPNILKLTLGEPDFNTPEHVKEAARQAITDNYSHYSGMAGLSDVREAAAYFMQEKYQLTYDPMSEILVTVGATEAITAALLAVLNPGDLVLMPTPIYTGYEPAIHLAQAQPVYIDTRENGFVLTPEMLEENLEKYGDKVKAIILNYPNNPTGVTYERDEIQAFAEVIRNYPVFVLSDEIYSELSYETQHVSIAEYLPEQTILINGLSKSHAMTGWRIGFLFAPEAITKQLVKVHQYLVTAASTISQKAAVRALVEGREDAEIMRTEYRKRRDFVYEKLTASGFEIIRPKGAFYIFAKIPAGYEQDSMKFCVDLAEQQAVAVIPGSAFGASAEGYLRISYAASFEILTEAMARIDAYMKAASTNWL